MRGYAHRISAPQTQEEQKEKEKAEKPLVPVVKEPSDLSVKSSQIKSSQAAIPPVPKKAVESGENGTPKAEAKKKSKSEQVAERHPKRTKRSNGPPGNLPGTKEAKVAARMTSQMSWESSKLGSSNGKLVLFVCPPYALRH